MNNEHFQKIKEIQKVTNFPIQRIVDAVKVLGHYDPEKVGRYIYEHGIAICRRNRDGTRMTEEQLEEMLKQRYS